MDGKDRHRRRRNSQRYCNHKDSSRGRRTGSHRAQPVPSRRRARSAGRGGRSVPAAARRPCRSPASGRNASGPPRNGAKPVPKITPASIRSASSTMLLGEAVGRFIEQRQNQPILDVAGIRTAGVGAAAPGGLPGTRRIPGRSSGRDDLRSPAAPVRAPPACPTTGDRMRATCRAISSPTESASSTGPMGMPNSVAAESMSGSGTPSCASVIASAR